LVNYPAREELKIICNVRVIGLDLPPRDMNVQNIVTIMMVLVENIVAMAVMAEQRKMI
jgi:hypothetical protein